MIPRAALSCLIVVPLLALALSGCIGAEDGPQVPAEGMRVTVQTGYDAGLRPATTNESRHATVDLPRGTPAREQIFQLVLQPIEGVDYSGWNGTPECTAGFVNRASEERRPPDCSDSDALAEIVVPPPEHPDRATRLNYRLDGDGVRVLVFPQPVLIAFRLTAIYSEPLLESRAEPDACHPYDTRAVGKHGVHTDGLVAEGSWLRVAGDATVDMPFYGRCDVQTV